MMMGIKNHIIDINTWKNLGEEEKNVKIRQVMELVQPAIDEVDLDLATLSEGEDETRKGKAVGKQYIVN